MRRSWAVIIVALALLAGCAKSPEERANELYRLGLKHLGAFEFEKADTLFKQIPEIDPASPLGLMGQGLAAERQLLDYDALNIHLTINDARPEFEPAFDRAYRVLARLGLYDDALEAAEAYWRHFNSSPQARLALGDAFLNLGQYDRARSELGLARDSGVGNPEAVELMLARIERLEGNLQQAQEIYDRQIAKPPQSPEFYCQAANYLETCGLIDSAMVLSRVSYGLAGDDFDMVVSHFQRALRTKYFADARRVVRDLEAKGAGKTVLLGFNFFYELARGDKNALRIVGSEYRAATFGSFSSTFYEMQARAEFGDMLSVIQDIGAINSGVYDSRSNATFAELYKFRANWLWVHYQKSPETLPKLENIKGKRANSKMVKLELAAGYLAVGKEAQAEELLNQLQQYHPGRPDWLTGIADVYRDFRKYDSAVALYQQALTARKWYLPAFEGLVTTYEKQALYDKALDVFDAYNFFETNYSPAALDKAHDYVENDQVGAGVELFEENIGRVKRDIGRFTALIELLTKKERPVEREVILHLLKEYDADNADALAYLARFYGDLGYVDSTLAYAGRALDVDDRFASAWVQKARALYYLEKKEEAIGIFDNNALKFPDNAENLYYYSRALADDNKDFEKAANMAREGVYTSFGNPYYVLNLSYVYYRMGRYDLSLGEAMKARNALKENPQPYFRIGMAMYQLKRPEARENLRKALDLGLKGDDRTIVMETLQKL